MNHVQKVLNFYLVGKSGWKNRIINNNFSHSNFRKNTRGTFNFFIIIVSDSVLSFIDKLMIALSLSSIELKLDEL